MLVRVAVSSLRANPKRPADLPESMPLTVSQRQGLAPLLKELCASLDHVNIRSATVIHWGMALGLSLLTNC